MECNLPHQFLLSDSWKEFDHLIDFVTLFNLDPLQLRDFRRTLYTFNEKHFNTYVAGAVAGHKKKGVQAVYGRYEYDDEKINAMKKWEQYLNKLARG